MFRDLKQQVIAVIGKVDSGKTSFIRTVCDVAGNATHIPSAAEGTPTMGIVEYLSVPLADGRVLTFLDTPGLDGYQPEGRRGKETEEILQMLEEHLAVKGSMSVTHVLFFQEASDKVIGSDEFKDRAPHTFETLEGKLEQMTKERDELAAKYELLLQEKGAVTPVGEAALLEDGRRDSTIGSNEDTRTLRNRRQRLLDTISGFSAQIIATVAELDREALDVSHECEATRLELEADSAELKAAEGRFEKELENVNELVEEYTRLRREKVAFEEEEESLTAELDAPHSPRKKRRLGWRLKKAQAHLKDAEGLMAIIEEDYQKGCEDVDRAAAEIEKPKSIVQRKERELGEWLSPECEWFTKELENFRTLQSSIFASLDAMRGGLEDGWEGKLGDNAVFLEGLGGYTVHPEMVTHSKDWAPVIESLFLSQVSLGLSKEMSKFHSAVLQRLKIQEESAQREWRKGVEAIFEQRAPSFQKSFKLPQLIPLAEKPTTDVLEDPLTLSKEPSAGVSQDLSPPPPLLLKGHSCGVMSVVFSWDGSKIISGSLDNTVRVWDASTGKVQSVLTGHSSVCTSVAISSDGSWIVSGSEDRTVRIWDAVAGKAHRVLAGHDGRVTAVAFSWDGSRVCSGSEDKTVRVWDASTGVVQSVLEGHSKGIRSVAFSRDRMRIVSGCWDGRIIVWDSSSTICGLQKVLRGHTNGIMSVAFSMDATRIVSGSADHTMRVWDASTGSMVRILEAYAGIVGSTAISPDGSLVVFGLYDKTVRVWDVSTGKQQSVLEGHNGTVWSVAFSPDGRRLASGAFDNTIRIWDVSAPT
ncbi:hypothetical protein D9611_007283 [Ephemerocybe angulata]|uniref:G domain-containing protein n=1 Tax=Ephemerocybe angulata TaxID=980116 RepID=A0A8H5FL61_9AGAR|nr:hypothetical protein D9611_007283 [Tulosesus angulatus]